MWAFSDERRSPSEPEERARISRAVIQGLMAKADEALIAGTFDSRDDRHLSWVSMKLDERGWKELVTALAATLSEVEQIRGDAEKRLARSGAEAIPSTCAILGFESPPAPGEPPPASASGR
jgi:hypothetical protein